MMIRSHALAAAVVAAVVLAGEAAAAPDDAVSRGAYLGGAAGCVSCHTVAGGASFAGGRALATPFCTLYSPNITPDREPGIARATDPAFLRPPPQALAPACANS